MFASARIVESSSVRLRYWILRLVEVELIFTARQPICRRLFSTALVNDQCSGVDKSDWRKSGYLGHG